MSAWVELFPAAKPSARVLPAMVLDVDRNLAVLYGGADDATDQAALIALDDTWENNGTTWVENTGLAYTPGNRIQPAMAYDEANQVTVLFGGVTLAPGVTLLDDTWTYNGADWTQVFPASAPSARQGAVMCYDRTSGYVLLFGGNTGSASFETWKWDGSDWTQLTPVNHPTARYGSQMAFDENLNAPVIFGGQNGLTHPTDTQRWSGTNWVDLAPSTTPSSFIDQGMAFSGSCSGLVLSGDNDSNVWETWLFDGTDWSLQTPVTDPGQSSQPGICKSPNSGKVLAFGGVDTASTSFDWTWEYECNSITPVTGPAESTVCGVATLTGTVTPNMVDPLLVNWYFEWGTTTSYGNNTFGGTVDGFDPIPVSEQISGLEAGVTYHYRLVAYHGADIHNGDDETLEEGRCPPFINNRFSIV